jgi:phenylacetate-CoA ligase
MLISGIRVSRAQVKENLKTALKMPDISCTMERSCRSGADILLISLAMDEHLFSDEIKNLQKLVTHAQETLTEQNGIKVKIRLTQQRV